jgi:hypothetical protein
MYTIYDEWRPDVPRARRSSMGHEVMDILVDWDISHRWAGIQSSRDGLHDGRTSSWASSGTREQGRSLGEHKSGMIVMIHSFISDAVVNASSSDTVDAVDAQLVGL